jgi:hypothetical protein
MARRVPTIIVAMLLVSVVFTAYTARQAWGDGGPADKAAVAASSVEVLAPAEKQLLLEETMRVSTPSDLILQLTAECAITTELTTVGNDASEAGGNVRLWVEIEGVPVTVSAEGGDGKVTFCHRSSRRETSMFDDEDATIKTFESARQANAFNWFAFNVGTDAVYDKNGDNIIDIKVYGQLVTNATSNASAMAAVGQRSLIIEPTHAANDETSAATGQ